MVDDQETTEKVTMTYTIPNTWGRNFESQGYGSWLKLVVVCRLFISIFPIHFDLVSCLFFFNCKLRLYSISGYLICIGNHPPHHVCATYFPLYKIFGFAIKIQTLLFLDYSILWHSLYLNFCYFNMLYYFTCNFIFCKLYSLLRIQLIIPKPSDLIIFMYPQLAASYIVHTVVRH